MSSIVQAVVGGIPDFAGLKGKNGEPVVINAGDNNLGNLEMGGK
jgi:hypothetical protein